MKYCTKCGFKSQQDSKSCCDCGNPFEENEKSNSKNKVNSTKILVVLFLFILIFSIILLSANKSNDSFKPNKPSAISFVKNSFNSKTCDEYFSYLSNEMTADMKHIMRSDSTEECNEQIVEGFNEINNKMDFDKQCKELNKDNLNFDYIELGLTEIKPMYSDVILCSDELMGNYYFFLNYNELENNYKIVNDGEDVKEKVVKEKEREREIEEIENKAIELRKNPTNPACRVSPEAFIIDEENIISELPDNNKSVWVEMVMDENTIMVSYIILKGNENIITFATVDLYGLSNLETCKKEKATKFLKQFIEHKYVYLDGGYEHFAKNKYQRTSLKVPKKLLLKHVKIWKQDIDISTEVMNRLYGDKHGEDEIEVNTAMISSGFAITMSATMAIHITTNYGYSFKGLEYERLSKRFENEQEVAKVAKRGFWADGVCE